MQSVLHEGRYSAYMSYNPMCIISMILTARGATLSQLYPDVCVET